ncbi:MAG: hypothetical protein DCF26_03070 [Burkholderiales bacterium]|nr:MAG: hypothetical protein DCF26_03070 [Burkholderiales bacterium]
MPVERQRLHTRSVEYNGYRRADSLWDIEGELRDLRHYDTQVYEKDLLPAGQFVHRMAITATVDDALLVREITSRMADTPFQFCKDVEDSLQAIVGVHMGKGWRLAINERLGGVESCTHLRELLVNMATAALQTIPTWQFQERHRLGEPAPDERPHFLGQCHSWRLDGPVVMKYQPQFFQPTATAGNGPAKE